MESSHFWGTANHSLTKMPEQSFWFDQERTRIVDDLGPQNNISDCKTVLDDCARVAPESKPLMRSPLSPLNRLSPRSNNLLRPARGKVSSQSDDNANLAKAERSIAVSTPQTYGSPYGESGLDPPREVGEPAKNIRNPIELFHGLILDGPLPIVCDNAKLPAPSLLLSCRRRRQVSEGQTTMTSRKAKANKSKDPQREISSLTSSRWESIPQQKGDLSRSQSDHGQYHSQVPDPDLRWQFHSDHALNHSPAAPTSRWYSEDIRHMKPPSRNAWESNPSPIMRGTASHVRSRSIPKGTTDCKRDIDPIVTPPNSEYLSLVDPVTNTPHIDCLGKPDATVVKTSHCWSSIDRPTRNTSLPMPKPTRRASIDPGTSPLPNTNRRKIIDVAPGTLRHPKVHN